MVNTLVVKIFKNVLKSLEMSLEFVEKRSKYIIKVYWWFIRMRYSDTETESWSG